MKQYLSIALCAVMMAVCTQSVQAQNTDNGKRQRLTREQLAEAQGRHIAHALAFDDATAEKFMQTWLDYQKDVWALGPRMRHKGQTKTDAEAEKSIKERIERSQKLLDLREKYYKRYSQFLTQKQIERVYEQERHVIGRLARNGRSQGKGRTPMAKRRTPKH